MANIKTQEAALSNRGKVGGYNSSTLHAKRDRKRQEAEDRQFAYDSLGTAKQLEQAKAAGGSKRQIARLEAKLANSQ